MVKTAFRGSLWEAFFLMEYLLSYIIDEKRKVSFNFPILEEDQDDEITSVSRKYIRICLDNYHGKLSHYYKFLNEISAYVAATVLNPSKR
jgi:hypothetical protein